MQRVLRGVISREHQTRKDETSRTTLSFSGSEEGPSNADLAVNDTYPERGLDFILALFI